MKKNYSIVIIFVTVLLSLTACYAQTAPVIKNKTVVQGLIDTVIVHRDERSIPYIEAKNESDLYFVQGYETARDRLWQMDLFRRVARGQLAELFGKQVLEEDKRWRRFGFSDIAEQSMKSLSPELKNALDNYARGVNAYIDTLDKKSLPVEFQILQYQPAEWKSTDTLVIGKILADGLSTTWWQDINRLSLQKNISSEKFKQLTGIVTEYDVILFGKDSGKSNKKVASNQIDLKLNDDLDQLVEVRKKSLERIGFYAKELAASNNWVISGKRTIDGKAILANDPHLRAAAPGIWYLSHLSTPDMKVAGVTFPGVPGVVLGHNQYFAWGATNVGPDVQDVYVEKFNKDGEYKTTSGWKKPVIRKEIIKVRGNLLKPDTENEVYEIVETKNGVVFNEQDGQKLSLKWTARNPLNQEFEAFIRLNKSTNWDEFKDSLKTYGGATQNFVYADVKGNIGWHVAGKIPIRRKGEGALPYDGATNDGDWVDFIPFEELPNLYNPPSGFIVTANQRIVGTDYKYQQLTRQFASPWRAKRIYELIYSNNKISMNDVSDIQHDDFNFPLSEFSREIVKRKSASTESLKILSGWDGRMNADSVGATLANQINVCVGNKISEENKPAGGFLIQNKILPWALPKNDKSWLPKSYQNWDELLRQCDSEAIDNLKKNKLLGENYSDWKWGLYNTASFGHPLAAAPLIGGQFKLSFNNVDGSGQTPNVGENVSMRFIAQPANWDETRHVIPLGQSGSPRSPHWKDQFESWRTGKPAIFPFSKEAVQKSSRESIMLLPN